MKVAARRLHPNNCAQKLSRNDLMELMRNHNEASWFDNTDFDKLDVGAGPGHSPYRRHISGTRTHPARFAHFAPRDFASHRCRRPLMWTSSGAKYVNERTVSTQQTAWALVACASHIRTTSQAVPQVPTVVVVGSCSCAVVVMCVCVLVSPANRDLGCQLLSGRCCGGRPTILGLQ